MAKERLELFKESITMILTVFTPTFNRAKYLRRIYESLEDQQCKEFEWLVIDDGSTDITKEVVKELSESSSFSIRYLYKENGGKHTAINMAAKEANGKFILWLDSDDWVLPNSLQEFYSYLLKAEQEENISAVVGLRLDNEYHPLGSYVPNDSMDVNFLEFIQKYKVKGDYSWAIKKQILMKYPFPIYEKEKFCPEGLVLNRISRLYKTRFVPLPVIIGSYIEGGLTDQIRNLTKKNPLGFINYYKDIVESPQSKLKYKIKYSILYWNQIFKSNVTPPSSLLPNKFMSIMKVPSFFAYHMLHLWRKFKEKN